MKFSYISQPATLAALLVLKTSILPASAADAPSGLRGGLAPIRGDAQHYHRILTDEATGTFLEADIQYEQGSEGGHETTLNIEMDDGSGIFELTNLPPGWQAQGQSGEARLTLPKGLEIVGTKIDMKGQAPGSTTVPPPFQRRLQSRTPEQERNLAELRRLQTYTCPGGGSTYSCDQDRRILAVRIVAADASYGNDEGFLRDAWLGTAGDARNLKNHYAACSYNKLIFNGADNKNMSTNPGNASTNISNGVVTVQIPEAVTGVSDGVIRNAANRELATNFGTNAANLADHVILCVPPGTSGSWIGYAYINSWNSVFNNQWCNYLSIQVSVSSVSNSDTGTKKGGALSFRGGTVIFLGGTEGTPLLRSPSFNRHCTLRLYRHDYHLPTPLFHFFRSLRCTRSVTTSDMPTPGTAVTPTMGINRV